MVFNAYATYYNLLYKDKNYKSEAAYVDTLIKTRHASATTLLDLGCGTGKHASEFVKLGYSVTGVDLSENMIEIAQSAQIPNATFHVGNITNFRIAQKFDVVVSLFHVMSYQVSNTEIFSAFQTASAHLEKGGIFIFDFWYGPAVLTDPPVVRVKRLENSQYNLTRISEPEMDYNNNIVHVNFDVRMTEKTSQKEETILEKHSMRYFFEPELNLLITSAGFENIKIFGWEKHTHPTKNDWNAIIVAQKK